MLNKLNIINKCHSHNAFSWSSYWAAKIIGDHRAINNHIPSAYYNEYYRPVLNEVLSPTYEDSEGIGYYYNKYGPAGLNKDKADFLLLFFIWNSWAAYDATQITDASGVRLNVEGIIYNQRTRPDHTFNGKEYFIINYEDDLSVLNSLKFYLSYIHRYWPSTKYLSEDYITVWMQQSSGIGILNMEGDMTDYVYHQPFVGALQWQTNSFSGIAPPIKTCIIYRIYNNYFTGLNITDSVIASNITEISIHNNRIEGSYLLQLVELLNAFYSVTPPTGDLILNMGGDDMGVIEGEIVEDVWQENSEITNLKAHFTDAGKTLTLTYNSDEYSFGVNVGILTFDDGPLTDLSIGVPILDKYSIKGTFYIIGSRIGNPSILTWEQVKSMEDNGHDMQCHTYSHPHLTTLTEAQIRDEMTNNNTAFSNNSITAPISTAYPYYDNNELVRATVADYRDISRAGSGAIGIRSFVFKDSDIRAIEATLCDITTEEQLQKAKDTIDACVRRKGIFVFSLHSPYADYGYDPDLLDELLDYAINTKEMTIMTIKEFKTAHGPDFV